MKGTKELQRQRQFFLGALGLVMTLFLVLFAEGFAFVSLAAGTGKVTASNGAKIRKEAATSSEMVGSAAYNQDVTINSSVQGSDGYTWYQVTVDGVSGYIRSDLLQTSGDTGTTGTTTNTTETPVAVTAVNPVSATVTGGQSVRIRSNASTTSQIVKAVSSGNALTVTGQATGTDGKTWYQVNAIVDGASVEGFIRSDYVNLSGELTPYTEPETPTDPDNTTPEEPETTPEPEPQKAYETVLKDGQWYLVVTETNEGYVIQDIFDKMASNVEEYAKLEKQAKTQKAVIIVLVILVVGAAGAAAFLVLKMRQASDDRYFNEVEKETLKRREAVRPENKKVMHTVGADRQGGAKATGSRPAGEANESRPAGAQGVRPVGAATRNRPAGAQGARPAGAATGSRPAGTQGTRPAGAATGSRPAGAATGSRPAGTQGTRPAGAPAGSRPAGTQGTRPAAPQENRPAGAQQTAKKPGWQSKNFMADDDDEFEFEFLNYDGEEE